MDWEGPSPWISPVAPNWIGPPETRPKGDVPADTNGTVRSGEVSSSTPVTVTDEVQVVSDSPAAASVPAAVPDLVIVASADR